MEIRNDDDVQTVLPERPADRAGFPSSPSHDGTPLALPTARPSDAVAEPNAVTHLDLLRLIERVHRRSLDLFRVDLSRLGIDDLSPSQVMVLFTIGPDDLSVRDLIDRGYYLGSNASYNLKRLVETGYVDRTASQRDRRSARIRLSEKGRTLCEKIRAADESYYRSVARDEEEERDLETTFRTLKRLEQVWSNTLRYGEAQIL
jgi:DNA-binding MarR family transcriptional regulator